MMHLIVVFAMACAVSAQNRVFKQEFSLKPPYVQHDNTRWETGAGAKVMDTHVRLTPDVPSRTGYLWSRIPSTMTDWETVLEMKIHGQNAGGEGMALWYVEKRMLGPVFGSADYWNGIGIFFDTNDNDKDGKNPLITAIYNDGTMAYSSYDDGASQSLASCQVHGLRNTQENAFVKITYLNQQLTLDIATSSNNGNPEYHRCFTVAVQLGLDKYFGMTAHTGLPMATNPPQPQMCDNHDLISVQTTDLSGQKVDLEQRRQTYKEEVENKHTQNKKYKELNSREFQHSALSLINQIQSTSQLIEEAQFNVLNHFVAQKDNPAASADESALMGEIRSMVSTIIRHQTELLGIASGGGGSGGSGGSGLLLDANAPATYSNFDQKSREIQEQLASMRAALEQIRNRAEGSFRPPAAGSSGGDRHPVVAALTSALDNQLNDFKAGLDSRMMEMSRANSASMRELQNLNAGETGGGGLGWFTWFLLVVLATEVVAICVYQGQSSQSSTYHKLV